MVAGVPGRIGLHVQQRAGVGNEVDVGAATIPHQVTVARSVLVRLYRSPGVRNGNAEVRCYC